LVAAGLVLAVTVAQQILSSIVNGVSNLAYAAFNGYGGFNPFVDFFGALFVTVLPFAVGVFLAFWVLVPLTAELAWTTVLVRAVVAAAIGAALALVATVVFGFFSALASAGPMFGGSFPSVELGNGFSGFVYGFQSAVSSFISLAPLVALAAVLTWLWLGKRLTRTT
jgi:hypothetical protein